MAGHNLCVFTPYNGMDPETGNGIYTLQADYNYVFSKEGGAVRRGFRWHPPSSLSLS